MTLINLVQQIVAWPLFARRDDVTGALDIIKWWELRRIPYNLIVGVAGLFTSVVTLLVAGVASELYGEPLGLPDPPIVAVLAVIGYGIGANVCFTGGWVLELLSRRIWKERAGAFGQMSFFFGLLFSVFLTLAPAVLFSSLLVIRLLLEPIS